MLDSGSNTAILKRRISNRLGLEGSEVSLVLSLAAGQESKPSKEKQVAVQLQSLNGGYTTPLFSAVTAKQPMAPLENVKIDTENFEATRGVKFTESYPQPRPIEIDILLDTNTVAEIQCGPVIKGSDFLGPKYFETKLGPVLVGAYARKSPPESRTAGSQSIGATVITRHAAAATSKEFARFFTMEDLAISEPTNTELSVENEQAVAMMEEVTEYCPITKKFSTLLLRKLDFKSNLDTNFKNAFVMANATRKKAIRTGTLDMVNHAYREQLSLGAAEEIRKEDLYPTDGRQVHYLPSHSIIRMGAESTRCRMVMNGSSKCRSTNVSLNQCLYQGPNLLPEILPLVLKLRLNVFVIICDIRKLYWTIGLREPDIDMCRYLWFNDEGELIHYRSLSLVFGLISSSYQTNFVSHRNADMWADEYPLASKVVKSQQYVDDVTTSVATREEAVKTVVELVGLFSKASLKPHKWCCSDETVLDDAGIETADRSKASAQKLLGVSWNTQQDSIEFDFTNILENSKPDAKFAPTKRQLLAELGRIYDVLGLVSPFTLIAKVILQECFRRELAWDTILPIDLATRFKEWREEVRNLEKITLPRLVIPSIGKGKVWLAIFADASKIAMACSAYVVGQNESRILMAKTRVAPIRQGKQNEPTYTIARLELCACVLAARLGSYLIENLGKDMFWKVRYFTDSTISLFRLKHNPSHYKIFVSNRVAEIQRRSDPESWRHCAGSLNASDIGSRSATATELAHSDLWKHAAPFILRPEECWPTMKALTPAQAKEQSELDRREFAAVKLTGTARRIFRPHIDFNKLAEKTSNWQKLVRVTSYCFRFILKKIPSVTSKTSLFKESPLGVKGPLRVTELRTATAFYIRLSQREKYQDDIAINKGQYIFKESSVLIQWGCFFDEQMIIRCSTRLSKSEKLPTNTVHPVLLPKNHPVIEKFLLYLHATNAHAKISAMYYFCQRNFHVAGGKKYLISVLRKCMAQCCRRPRPMEVAVGQMPIERIDNFTPWMVTACDMWGPFWYRSESDCDCESTKKKGFGIVFCDFYSRSIHCELMRNQSTESFLYCFQKLCTRRGTPSAVYSDRAKSFERADREIRRLYKGIDKDRVEEATAEKGVQWFWGTSRFSADKGVVEVCVGFIKKALRTTLANSSKIPFPQLESIVYSIEAFINDRPLQCPSESFEEGGTVVTPSFICHGRQLQQLPFDREQLDDSKPFSRLQLHRKTLVSLAFRSWKKQYLMGTQALRWAKKGESPPLRENQVVLLRDATANIGKERWDLAKIVEVKRSQGDNMIRRLKLKNKKGNIIDRHVSEVALLPHDIREIEKTTH